MDGVASTALGTAGAAGDGADVTFCGIVIPLKPSELPGTTGTLPAADN